MGAAIAAKVGSLLVTTNNKIPILTASPMTFTDSLESSLWVESSTDEVEQRNDGDGD
jgi:hypothetical protein